MLEGRGRGSLSRNLPNDFTYVERTFKGSESIDDTDPVKSVLYIRQAVKGTTPNQANATIV